MRTPVFVLTPDELEGLAIRLRDRGALSWLDGGAHAGSGELGRCSHLAFGPSELSVARMEDGDPFAPIRGLSVGPSVGDPRALLCTVVLTYDAAWSAPSRFGLRRPLRIARSPRTIVSWVRRYEAALVYDHETGEAHLGAHSPAALARAEAEVQRELELLRARAAIPPLHIAVTDVSSEPRALHEARIRVALSAIARGELYQVNLARAWRARWTGSPLALATAMRRASPVPLGAYLEGPEQTTLIARTMERFLHVDPRSRRIESRPIKGTIDVRVDSEAALLASTKERAEHAMIVDLVRNDLGRVATAGTVRTPSLFRVEPYAHLFHLVSVIEAELREGVTLEEVLLSTFPPASISGAPKLAAIEHIEALEEDARGPYTGALGMIARDGTLSLAVAIRTAELVEEGPGQGSLTYFAGGGIVEASEPLREVEETELKARAFLDAVASLAR